MDECIKRIINLVIGGNPQHAPGRNIGLSDQPVLSEVYVSHWSMLIKICIAVTRLLQFSVGGPKLFILDLEFDLMDLQFIDKEHCVHFRKLEHVPRPPCC